MQAAEDRLKVLGKFLRAKRRSLLPEECGVNTHRRRLSPGLSREETAVLAHIGASWYARLEAGRVPHPSLATMRAVSSALQLSPPEVTFAFELAGILTTNQPETQVVATLGPISELLRSDDLVSMSIWGRYLAPIGWNLVGDAMYQFSRHANRVLRNPIVRLEDPEVVQFFGDAYDDYARSVVGLFRRGYSAGDLTPYGAEVFELGSKLATFRKYWDEHVVTDSVTVPGQQFVRHHPVVGSFSAIPIDLMLPEQQGFLRVLSAADEESRAKFLQLRALGRKYDPAVD
jgi:transcriptional regulator with XRE-family HTH domain